MTRPSLLRTTPDWCLAHDNKTLTQCYCSDCQSPLAPRLAPMAVLTAGGLSGDNYGCVQCTSGQPQVTQSTSGALGAGPRCTDVTTGRLTWWRVWFFFLVRGRTWGRCVPTFVLEKNIIRNIGVDPGKLNERTHRWRLDACAKPQQGVVTCSRLLGCKI